MQITQFSNSGQDFGQFHGQFHNRHASGSQNSAQTPSIIIEFNPSPEPSVPLANPPATVSPDTGTQATTGTTQQTATAGPAIILNLGQSSSSGPEDITISLNQNQNGSEELTIGVGNQSGQNQQTIDINLPQNSTQQIILNLLATTTTPSTQGNTLNVAG